MKLKVIACKMFEPYLEYVKNENVEYDITFLEMALHTKPQNMEKIIQSLIDSSQDFDGIVLLYGECGGGSKNLTTNKTPVLLFDLPDCIHILCDSYESDTYYHSCGYLRGSKSFVANKINYEKAGYDSHPDYKEYCEKYGKKNALEILKFCDSWKKNYKKCAYITANLPMDKKHLNESQKIAHDMNWNHKEVFGTLEKLRKILCFDTTAEFVRIILPKENTEFIPHNLV